MESRSISWDSFQKLNKFFSKEANKINEVSHSKPMTEIETEMIPELFKALYDKIYPVLISCGKIKDKIDDKFLEKLFSSILETQLSIQINKLNHEECLIDNLKKLKDDLSESTDIKIDKILPAFSKAFDSNFKK